MRRKHLLLLAVAAVALVAAAAFARTTAPEIEKQLQQLAVNRDGWPGFDPLRIPLAVYDGAKTYLFRHPSPGPDFTRLDPGTHVMSGRHPAVNSNTSAEIGGVATATLMADGKKGDQPADELAAVALHESFHVYQRAHHKGWSGNEGDMLLYPFDHAATLALRRMETEALRRALATKSKAETECWARRALSLRYTRFAGMDSAYSRYERLTELNEGLATYVELYALWRKPEFPKDEFAAEAIRQRVYTVGPAWAYLLDLFYSEWKQALEKNDRQSLDGMLAESLGSDDRTGGCDFTREEKFAFTARAQKDAGAVIAKRKERREKFDARDGWRIVVESSAKHLLWPNGFDPLNVELVDGGLLHTRFASLKNDDGSVEVLDGEGADITMFTSGPGPHPLFNGVSRAEIIVAAKPHVNIWGEHRVEVKAPGVKVRLEHADVHEKERAVIVRLGH